MMNRRLNVLSVDDMSGIRYLLSAIVNEAGHNSYTASTGSEALELLEAVKIDLVFLDIKLPDINGIAVVEQVKKLNYAPVIVAMTGFSEQHIIDRIYQCGVTHCIIKPFNVDEIYAIIRDTVIGRVVLAAEG